MSTPRKGKDLSRRVLEKTVSEEQKKQKVLFEKICSDFVEKRNFSALLQIFMGKYQQNINQGHDSAEILKYKVEQWCEYIKNNLQVNKSEVSRLKAAVKATKARLGQLYEEKKTSFSAFQEAINNELPQLLTSTLEKEEEATISEKKPTTTPPP